MGLRAEYDRRIARWSAAIERGERTHLLISNLRLAAAAAAAVLAWLALGRGVLSPGRNRHIGLLSSASM